MKEYKIAKGWAIFIYLTAPFLIALFGWLLILPIKAGTTSPNISWIFIPVSIGMMALMIVGVIDAYKSRLIIDKEKIASISTLSKRELKLHEIKGYTVNEQYIIVEPKDKHKKKIKISKYVSKTHEITLWLSKRFPDLDLITAKEEEQEILTNQNLGWTTKIREEKLKKARKTAKIINWAGGLSAAWTFFYPTPYQLAILSAMAIPVIALVAVKLSDGLIRIDERKGSAYPSVIYGLIYPSLGLMLRAFLDFDIFEYDNVWGGTILLTLTFVGLVFLIQKELSFKNKLDYFTLLSISLFLFFYSLGTIIHINCYYDDSQAEQYEAKILNKRVSSGKSTSYYFELSPWGRKNEIDEVTVDKSLYNRMEVGEEVKIYFKNGKLDIPWFMVDDR
ncbi:hypothetical protein [Cesiribacter sp. SM1]|uniref:hypothetical protein n=1 Tax=Cesiribacter sp. SM1 TaxID=2861196 RepID=UPI001CD713D1|nr:hypothetical protein [Cesiribacter sp. SM1]